VALVLHAFAFTHSEGRWDGVQPGPFGGLSSFPLWTSGRTSSRFKGGTMRTAIDVKKEVARSVGLESTSTLFSIKPAQSTAILPEERLASEVQALLNSAAGVIECATGGHGRCVNSGCHCRCHHSRARTRPKRLTP